MMIYVILRVDYDCCAALEITRNRGEQSQYKRHAMPSNSQGRGMVVLPGCSTRLWGNNETLPRIRAYIDILLRTSS